MRPFVEISYCIKLVIQILVRGLDADGQSLKDNESDDATNKAAAEYYSIKFGMPSTIVYSEIKRQNTSCDQLQPGQYLQSSN